MNHEAMWRSLDGTKFEHVKILANNEGINADGLMIHLNDTETLRMRYRIHCDTSWQIHRAELMKLDETDERLLLLSDGNGTWRNERDTPIDELNGCRDIDIHFSPFTNTLAIRRLNLQSGESAKIEAVFIAGNTMQLTTASQRYTHLGDNNSGSYYKYEGLSTGFTKTLPVDQAGLLLEYPGFFERIWPGDKKPGL